MKNIWILNHYANPPDTPGHTRHFEFAQELLRRGYQVTIFSSGFNHRTRKEERLGAKQSHGREVIGGVDFIWIKTLAYYKGNDWRRAVNMLSYTFRVIPLGIKLRERPDVIYASSPHPFAGLAGYVLAKIMGAKFIFEVRDLWPQTLVDIGGYSNKSVVVLILRVLERFLYKRSNGIITLGPKDSDYITTLGIPYDKILHIPNGVDPELFSADGGTLPDEIGGFVSKLRAEGKFLVGYAGAHGISNALDIIIEAAQLLQNRGETEVHFLMVGDGPEKEPLIFRAKSCGLTNMSFYSSVPKVAVPTLLKSFDIGVISIRKSSLYRYGISLNKLYDYMACSLPTLVATDAVNNPVEESLCGITVPPENPDAMAEAIQRLRSTSKNEMHNMGARGFEYVMKNHAMSTLTDKLLEILEPQTSLNGVVQASYRKENR